MALQHRHASVSPQAPKGGGRSSMWRCTKPCSTAWRACCPSTAPLAWCASRRALHCRGSRRATPTPVRRRVLVAGNGDSIFKRLMAAIGRQDLGQDPSSGQCRRVARVEQIDAAIGAWTASATGWRRAADAEFAGVRPVGSTRPGTFRGSSLPRARHDSTRDHGRRLALDVRASCPNSASRRARSCDGRRPWGRQPRPSWRRCRRSGTVVGRSRRRGLAAARPGAARSNGGTAAGVVESRSWARPNCRGSRIRAVQRAYGQGAHVGERNHPTEPVCVAAAAPVRTVLLDAVPRCRQ